MEKDKLEMEWIRIEEEKEFKYLSYIVRNNGSQEAQVRERVKKRAAFLGQVWRIRKKNMALR